MNVQFLVVQHPSNNSEATERPESNVSPFTGQFIQGILLCARLPSPGNRGRNVAGLREKLSL